MKPDVTVVLPAYNNKSLAEHSVRTLHTFLSKNLDNFEIILVDDGSQPAHRIDSQNFASNVKIMRNIVNEGKGSAVKKGMLAAQGKCRVYTDIDLPYDLQAILDAYAIISSGKSDCVTGDRTHPESTKSVKSSFLRTSASLITRKISSLLITGQSMDTQCGFKAFSGSLTDALFPLLTINRFAFDIEIFYLLAKNKVSIARIPVHHVNATSSTVRIVPDGFKTFIDTLTISWRWYWNYYPKEKLTILKNYKEKTI